MDPGPSSSSSSVLKPHANDAALISGASHECSDPNDADRLGKEMGSIAIGDGPGSRRKGWLGEIAPDRTAYMKNLLSRRTVPQNKKLPIFGPNETVFNYQPAANIGFIISSYKKIPGRYVDGMGTWLKEEKEAIILAAAKNWLENRNLLRLISADEKLSGCKVVVIDQRTAATELLFERLKKSFQQRPDLIVFFDSSGVTWDSYKFEHFYSECKFLEMNEDTFPVTILYLEEPTSDYLYAAAFTVVQIHMAEDIPTKDIIVFLAGEEEIYQVHRLIIEQQRLIQGGVKAFGLMVLQIYHRGRNDPRLLDPDTDIFSLAKTRKVYLTTDKAIAMFDLENIYYVIDCGFETRVAENRKLETNSLEVAPISQDLAGKRASQAGWMGPLGRCYRLYTEAAYLKEMIPETEPEILRANLGETLLLGEALGLSISLMDHPGAHPIVMGSRQLCCLGAFDNELKITYLGRCMSDFPIPPVLSRILFAASFDFRCSEEALTIVAMVLTQNVFERPEEEEKLAEAELKRVGFFQSGGDHLTLLDIFESWRMHEFSSLWCEDHFIWYRPMYRAIEIRNQLMSIMDSLSMRIVSAEKDYTNIRKAITAGLFLQAAKWDPVLECYQAWSDGRRLHINPRSALFGRQPSYVVFDDLHVNSDGQEFMIGVTEVELEWLLNPAPQYFSKAAPTMMMMDQGQKRGVRDPDADQSSEPKRNKQSG